MTQDAFLIPAIDYYYISGGTDKEKEVEVTRHKRRRKHKRKKERKTRRK
jgi:hypothetical protein